MEQVTVQATDHPFIRAPLITLSRSTDPSPFLSFILFNSFSVVSEPLSPVQAAQFLGRILFSSFPGFSESGSELRVFNKLAVEVRAMFREIHNSLARLLSDGFLMSR